CEGSTPFSLRVWNTKVRIQRITRVAKPPARIAEADLFHAILDLEPPGIGGVARKLPFDAVFVRTGPLYDLKLRMRGKNLIVHTADPVAAGTDLTIRHR